MELFDSDLPQLVDSFQMYQISWHPVRSQATQNTVLRMREDRLLEAEVAGGVHELLHCVASQRQLVLLLDVSVNMIEPGKQTII